MQLDAVTQQWRTRSNEAAAPTFTYLISQGGRRPISASAPRHSQRARPPPPRGTCHVGGRVSAPLSTRAFAPFPTTGSVGHGHTRPHDSRPADGAHAPGPLLFPGRGQEEGALPTPQARPSTPRRRRATAAEARTTALLLPVQGSRAPLFRARAALNERVRVSSPRPSSRPAPLARPRKPVLPARPAGPQTVARVPAPECPAAIITRKNYDYNKIKIKSQGRVPAPECKGRGALTTALLPAAASRPPPAAVRRRPPGLCGHVPQSLGGRLPEPAQAAGSGSSKS